jgi:hypothetical protein
VRGPFQFSPKRLLARDPSFACWIAEIASGYSDATSAIFATI